MTTEKQIQYYQFGAHPHASNILWIWGYAQKQENINSVMAEEMAPLRCHIQKRRTMGKTIVENKTEIVVIIRASAMTRGWQGGTHNCFF